MTVRQAVTFDVAGIPAPQGSKKGFAVNGKVRLVEASGEPLKMWRQEVIAAASEAASVGDAPTGGVFVQIDFRFPRPKSLPRRAGVWKVTRPDIDKLARGVLDALTIAGVIRDDSQVGMLLARKMHCIEGQVPGATITVTELEG